MVQMKFQSKIQNKVKSIHKKAGNGFFLVAMLQIIVKVIMYLFT